MTEQLTFAANTGSFGRRVLDRQDRSTCYGVVWHDPNGVCAWVAEFPGNRPGSGGIPGFTSRTWAARFLYRYCKPEPSGRP
ncbi:hypothetical protein OHT57_47030 [Streptomyces sp. NBC_00285]|uniref:hypothetical protein n=1 Tax=Streptomyces sp. NBC_00285 TaxID=2975700 RepID=UPI002E2B5167|nr:hypothetical protein [Streptomyces sp. NBC_00285]